jgi:hypothetical protein
VREQLKEYAIASGFASRMATILGEKREEIRKAASESNLDFWYSLAWGKLSEARRKALK